MDALTILAGSPSSLCRPFRPYMSKREPPFDLVLSWYCQGGHWCPVLVVNHTHRMRELLGLKCFWKKNAPLCCMSVNHCSVHICNRIWSSWDENERLQVWGHGLIKENDELRPPSLEGLLRWVRGSFWGSLWDIWCNINSIPVMMRTIVMELSNAHLGLQPWGTDPKILILVAKFIFLVWWLSFD